MSKLYVVRHAEPEVTGVLLGRTDPPLSAAGRRDAASRLGQLDVRIVYSSPLRRCRETAGAIGAPLVVLDNLAEIALGEWDGLSWSEVEQRYPELARVKVEDWFRVTPPGGEPWDAFASRVRDALGVILAGPLPAAVAGHLAANAVLAEALGGEDPYAFRQDYGEIRRFAVGGGK